MKHQQLHQIKQMYISKFPFQNGRSAEACKQSDKRLLEKNKSTCYLRQDSCTGSFLSVSLVQRMLTTNRGTKPR